MKKLYKKGTVHPTPPLISDHLLSFLPATIFTLTAALSSQDREVLAYLLSCSSNNYAGNNNTTTTHKNSTAAAATSSSSRSGGDHPTSFNCCCFRCYMSYWARWDASPNRQLIHEIIDTLEEGLAMQGKIEKSSRRERRKGRSSRVSTELRMSELSKDELRVRADSVEDSSASAGGSCGGGGGVGDGYGGGEIGEEEEELQKGSMRRFVSFLGEKIWGAWN